MDKELAFAVQYLGLTEAIGYVAGAAMLSPEEFAVTLRKDAEHYRWWRKNRETTLVVAIFGNGCINKTIEMVEAEVDAARLKTPAVGDI